MSSASMSIDEVVGQHQTIYDVYFSQADTTCSGAIGALDAANFLKQSKLKDSVLKEIWELSDPTGKGYLDRKSFYYALKLIALAQSSQPVKIENLNLPTQAPKLGELSSNITSLILPDDAWYIKASQRLSFDKIFDSLSPIAGKLTGARVKPFLVSTSLPVDVLGKIWELSDLDNDGALDRDEFLISMQLMTKAKEGLQIPDILPPSLLPFKVRHTPIMSSNSPGGSSTSVPYPVNLNSINDSKPWIVTFEEKSKSDIVFNQMDTDKDGLVNGYECKDVFLQTGLSQMILANIWSLCDVNSCGKLNSEQFALAMHFINKKLSTGLDAPLELTPEMIPPSLRPKPTMAEDSPYSRDLEELQLQVTELQREKLYYDQRASEHETVTRQKRTELSNLELEMESIFKTIKEREMKKSQEQKKLEEYEDKLVKYDTHLVDLQQKYLSEKEEIERLKMQIQHMDAAMKNKDHDLSKIKSDLQILVSEQASLEMRINSRRNVMLEVNNSFDLINIELIKNKNRIEVLKTIQVNLNKQMKEYNNTDVQFSLNNEIKRLEDENLKLNEKLKLIDEANAETLVNMSSFGLNQNNSTFNESNYSDKFSPPSSIQFQSSSANGNGGFDNFFSPADSQTVGSVNAAAAEILGNGVDDPFQAFDPFKDSSDPFKSVPISLIDKSADFSATDDPFSSPFNPSFTNGATITTTAPLDDPFNNKKSQPPPRPAPPRPQTPNMKPTKKTAVQTRPHTSLDFTRNNNNNNNNNNNLDLFNNFSDPFHTPVQNKVGIDLDPFGNNNSFEWNAFGNNNNNKQVVENKDTWDPFA